ncbi:DegV family protein [Acidaminobacter sp. JC074]|uniref:DegV family protein n=1 Tax=Acidaminobacter sp. JC074 TaxID=2530199 RepID=UPI001F0DC105|nr:DegV family protein [Acidaminobacter sp. JC074]MCH4886850.1 DegV family protein [Acidaminobacter sp. JC074]
MIKILADSTCDLSDEILEKYEIGIAPLTIKIGDKVYKDRVDIQPEEFYGMLGALPELPTTAMPSPTEFINLYEDAHNSGHNEILCICMSSGTSGSYQSAVIAKEYFDEKYGDQVKVHVVDSKCMSHGSGYLILKSAMLRERGATFNELIDFNETYKTNIKHFLSVDDLDNLIKSGRLTEVSAMIGKVLKVKPVMSMRNGKGAIVAKVRGSKKVFKHYVDEYKKRVDIVLTDFIIIGYTSDKSVAETMKAKLQNETQFKGDIYIMQMGVSVGTHVGLGGLSMYFVEKGDRHDGLIYNEMSSLLDKKDEMLEMLKKYRKEMSR